MPPHSKLPKIRIRAASEDILPSNQPQPQQAQQQPEQKIKLNRPLPVSLITPSAGDHLYMIGTAYYKRDSATHRYRFHLPTFFLFATGLVCSKSLIAMLAPPEYDDWLIWFGDVALILKLKVHFNLLLLTFDYIVFFLHALHYLVYGRYRKYGIRPNLAPFDLAAGLITPRAVGLQDRHKVLLFARFCKWSLPGCLFLTRYVMNVFCWSAYFMAFVVKMVKMDSWAIWPICFGHSLLWGLKSHIFFTYFFFHMLHFYIICFYLRLKMDTIEVGIERMIKMRMRVNKSNDHRILTLLSSLKSLYHEISQFNSSFWCKFIFCVWSSYSINVSLFIYSAIFGKVDLMIRGLIWLVSLIEIVSVVALCWIASSVNKKARVMYWSLNSLNLRTEAINVRTRAKFSTCIETWSSSRIGFTNWRLFPMTYFTFYEMVAIVVTFFLKLVQMQNEE